MKCNFSSACFVFVVTVSHQERNNAALQSADPVPLFTVVISGLFIRGASFSLAHEYSTRNQNCQQ